MNTPSITSPRRAIVLLSGGLDSATTLAIARDAGFDCYCLSLDYGQRHRVELEAASRVAQALGAKEHRLVRLDLAAFGGSALTDRNIDVPTAGPEDGIPVTYVPARNTIMLSLALAWAEVLESRDIFVGVNAETIQAIRTAGRNSSPLSNSSPISPPRPAWKANG